MVDFLLDTMPLGMKNVFAIEIETWKGSLDYRKKKREEDVAGWYGIGFTPALAARKGFFSTRVTCQLWRTRGSAGPRDIEFILH